MTARKILLVIGVLAAFGCASPGVPTVNDAETPSADATADLTSGSDTTSPSGSDVNGADLQATSDVEGDTTLTADSDGNGTLFVPGKFGEPCTYNTDCESGFCVTAPSGSPYANVCTRQCDAPCPTGWFCKIGPGAGQEVNYICIPEINKLCQPCLQNSDCIVNGDRCEATEKDGGKTFCAKDCSHDPDNPNVCPVGYQCNALRNEENKIYAYQCQPKTGSCECDESINLQTDPNNCGTCNNKCTFDNSDPTCEDGECKIGTCKAGWVDLNQLPDDGCEYECTKTSDTDTPDADLKDANCDGIDGDWLNAVFVDANQGSDENGDGSPARPYKTIAKGILVADAANIKLDVYVADGVYYEMVTVKSGVSIYGGFSGVTSFGNLETDDWKRNPALYKSHILSSVYKESHAVIAVYANNISADTVIAGFTIESTDNANDGGSSYAVYIKNSTDKLVIRNNVIKSGRGKRGKDGTDGTTVPDLNSVDLSGGDNGEHSITDAGIGASEKGGLGGDPGYRVCIWQFADTKTNVVSKLRAETWGGKGGKGGDDAADNWSKHGYKGDDSELWMCVLSFVQTECSPNTKYKVDPDILGGNGGLFMKCNGDNEGCPGDKGFDGKPGDDGENGPGGDLNIANLLSNGFWVGAAGRTGMPGTPGHGGGGGGGGGGQNAWNKINDRGGGGGGGGGGGCPGLGGVGGQPGGSSFGVFLYNSSAKIIDNSISTSDAGGGGDGGKGALGQSGGDGGLGGIGDEEGGDGGKGGPGGKGGKGGHGGGGSGGVSYGIYHNHTGPNGPTCSNNIFPTIGNPGQGGKGYDASGNLGSPGKKGSISQQTALCTVQ